MTSGSLSRGVTSERSCEIERRNLTQKPAKQPTQLKQLKQLEARTVVLSLTAPGMTTWTLPRRSVPDTSSHPCHSNECCHRNHHVGRHLLGPGSPRFHRSGALPM